MEKNNIAHNVKTYISFDGCHQGANVPIGIQNYIEYVTKKGIFKKNTTIREGLYNGLAARQMLAHHVSAGSNFPAPDALRTKFLQNLTAVNEYPQLCRKVAVINGSKTGQLNPNQPLGSTLLFISTQKKDWKSLWGLCQNKLCKKLEWKCSIAPSSGTQKVAEMWTADPLFNILFWVPLGQKNYYATAAWGNSSQDNAPGGMSVNFFGSEPGQINEGNLVFLLKEFLYLLTGSKRTTFSQNLNRFTMMPSYSSADLRFSSKNLYMQWNNQYLCGKTPFDYVYAPSLNEEHVLVSANGAQWFENEIRYTSINLPVFTGQISGNDNLCNGALTYSLEICKPGIPISWSASPSGIVTLTPNGDQVTLTKIGNGIVTLSASVAGVYPLTLTKSITVGIPAISSSSITAYRFGNSCYYDAAVTLSAPGTIVEFSFNNSNWFPGYQSGNVFRSGNGDFMGPMHQMVYARTSNACGKSAVVSKNLSIPKPPGGCLMFQPPVQSRKAQRQFFETDITHRETIAVYPNPAGSKLTVAIPANSENAFISIYDAGGKLIYTGRLNTAITDLNISSYRSGLYLVKVLSGGTITKSVKIIKR